MNLFVGMAVFIIIIVVDNDLVLLFLLQITPCKVRESVQIKRQWFEETEKIDRIRFKTSYLVFDFSYLNM